MIIEGCIAILGGKPDQEGDYFSLNPKFLVSGKDAFEESTEINLPLEFPNGTRVGTVVKVFKVRKNPDVREEVHIRARIVEQYAPFIGSLSRTLGAWTLATKGTVLEETPGYGYGYVGKTNLIKKVELKAIQIGTRNQDFHVPPAELIYEKGEKVDEKPLVLLDWNPCHITSYSMSKGEDFFSPATLTIGAWSPTNANIHIYTPTPKVTPVEKPLLDENPYCDKHSCDPYQSMIEECDSQCDYCDAPCYYEQVRHKQARHDTTFRRAYCEAYGVPEGEPSPESEKSPVDLAQLTLEQQLNLTGLLLKEVLGRDPTVVEKLLHSFLAQVRDSH